MTAMSDDERVVPFRRRQKAVPGCPVCGRPAAPAQRPFCSKRCAEVDLGRWLKGTYRIPSEEAPTGAPGEAEPAREDAAEHED